MYQTHADKVDNRIVSLHQPWVRQSFMESRSTSWQRWGGKRGEIERDFGVGKPRYSLVCIMTKLKHTSEVAVRMAY